MWKIMGLFGTTRSQRDHDELIALQKRQQELEHEVDAVQRKLDAVDLHARSIVEEAKRLINKFERRLDRETPSTAEKTRQDAPGTTNGEGAYLGPTSRRNY